MAPRALDHIVWPARDLEGLAEAFRRLGFTVGRRNRHPWGTLNHIIQFDGCFLELLGFAEDYQPLSADDPAYPFAGFSAAFLDHTAAGAAMVVLRSEDAEVDARAFAARSIGYGRVLPFSRAAQGPDGSDRTVSFTVAFADLPGLPEVGAFVCQQHRPENFWSPAAQVHANGATGIAAPMLVTPDPAAVVPALQLFANQEGLAAVGDGLRIALANGALDIVPPPAQSGTPSAAARSWLSSVTIAVSDLSRSARLLDQAEMGYAVIGNRLSVRAPEIGRTGIVFRAESSA